MSSDSLGLKSAQTDGQLACSSLLLVGKKKKRKEGEKEGGMVNFPSSPQSSLLFILITLFSFADLQPDPVRKSLEQTNSQYERVEYQDYCLDKWNYETSDELADTKI